jgi:Uma2 family endonuclease
MGALRKARENRAHPMTVDEFLALPNDSLPKKKLLLWGELKLMNPPMARHSALQVTVGSLLRDFLKRNNKPCRVGAEAGIIPEMGSDVNYLQPDLVVTCEKPDPDARTFREPLIILELLSQGNLSATRSHLGLYASIASVTEVVFLHSGRIRAEIWRRSPTGRWSTDSETIGRGSIFKLTSIGFQLPIEQLYEDTGLI